MRILREQFLGCIALLAMISMGLLVANELDVCRCFKRPLFRVGQDTELTTTIKHLDWGADGRTLLIEARNWDSGSNRLSVHHVGGTGYVPSWVELIRESLTHASMSPDGKSIVAGTVAGELWWIDLETAAATEVVKLEQDASFEATAISHDGQTMAGITSDYDIYLCNPTLATQKRLRCPSTDRPHKLQFSPNGRRLLSVQRNGTVIVWSTETGKQLCEIKGEPHLPYTTAAFLSDSSGVISLKSENRLQIWDIDSNEERWHGADGAYEKSGITAIDVASNGSLVAWNDAMTNRVVVWDLETQRIKYEIPNPSMVLNLKFSPDGRSLAIAGLEPILRIYDVASGKETSGIDVRKVHENSVRT